MEFQDQHIGEYLKRQREEKGIELKFISQRTKININILKKIEENRLKELPNLTYVKSFVLQYAREINLDPNEVQKVLQHTFDKYGFQDQGPKIVHRTNFLDDEEGEEKPFNVQKFIQDNKIAITVMVTSFVAVGLIMLIRYTQNKVSEPKTEVQVAEVTIAPTIIVTTIEGTPVATLAATTPTITVTPVVTTTILPSVTPTLKITPILTPTIKVTPTLTPTIKVTPTLTPTIKVTPTLTPTIKVTPTLTPTIKVTPTVTVTPTAAGLSKSQFPAIELKPFTSQLFTLDKNAEEIKNTEILPSNFKAALSIPGQSIYIRAYEDNNWLTYKVDGKEIKFFTLRQGRSLFLRGNVIQLQIGNVTKARVFYKGSMMRFDKQAGLVNIVLPPEKTQEHSLPLFIRDKAGKIYSAQEYKSALP
jgi:cytoskeletal protein RodZ